jgi:YbbR domain-containing protein
VNRLLANLGAVLLSLILAVGVWVLAVQDENPVLTGDFDRPIAVKLTGLENGLTIVGEPLREVTLRLRATRRVWEESLRSQDFAVVADLSGLGPGRHSVPLAANYPDEEVEIMEIKPGNAVLTLEEVISRQVPVEAEVLGDPVFGYEWLNSIVTPTQVTVTGPPAVVDQITRAMVQVAITGARSNVERRQPVTLRNERDEAVTGLSEVSPNTVQVAVEIAQREGYRDFSVRVPYTGTVAQGYQISSIVVEPTLVTLRGNPDAFKVLPGFVETVPIDISNASDDVVAQLALNLPETLSAVGQQSVDVRIQVEPIVNSRTVQARPVIRGLGQGLTRTVSIDTVDLVVRGPLPILDTLGAGVAVVILDLSELGPGVHSVPLRPVVPEGVAVVSLLPQTVDITILELATSEPTPTSTLILTTTVIPSATGPPLTPSPR